MPRKIKSVEVKIPQQDQVQSTEDVYSVLEKLAEIIEQVGDSIRDGYYDGEFERLMKSYKKQIYSEIASCIRSAIPEKPVYAMIDGKKVEI